MPDWFIWNYNYTKTEFNSDTSPKIIAWNYSLLLRNSFFLQIWRLILKINYWTCFVQYTEYEAEEQTFKVLVNLLQKNIRYAKDLAILATGQRNRSHLKTILQFKPLGKYRKQSKKFKTLFK